MVVYLKHDRYIGEASEEEGKWVGKVIGCSPDGVVVFKGQTEEELRKNFITEVEKYLAFANNNAASYNNNPLLKKKR
jgi:hypothetical protein